MGLPIGLILFLTHFIAIYWLENLKNFNLIIASFFLLHFIYSFTDAGLLYIDYFYFFAFWSVALIHFKKSFDKL